MARYNFQLRSQSHVRFSESADLQGLEEARVEAAQRVGTLLHEHAKEIWVDEDWRMDVTDATGLILFTIQIFVTDAAAVGGGSRTGGPGRLPTV